MGGLGRGGALLSGGSDPGRAGRNAKKTVRLGDKCPSCPKKLAAHRTKPVESKKRLHHRWVGARGVAAHSGAARPDGAGQNGMSTGRIAQKTTAPSCLPGHRQQLP